MKQLSVLIIENKPLYAEAMATHLKQGGISCIQVASSQHQALLSIMNQPPSLMLANSQLVAYPHLLKADCPYVQFEIHDGSQLDQPPVPEWTKGSLLSFPCSVELFRQAVETALAFQYPEFLLKK